MNQTIEVIQKNLNQEKTVNTVTITHPSTKKLKAAVIGCTGLVGQSIVDSLVSHPYIQIVSLHGFETVGQPYRIALRSAKAGDLPEEIANMEVKSVDSLDFDEIDLIFSAIPSERAAEIEPELAKKIPVFSTASWARYHPGIPIFLPVVNGHHSRVFRWHQQIFATKGFICPGPNCTTVGLAVALYPIFKKYGLKSVTAVSMQAVSGAGYAGVSSFNILGNIIPHIPEEESKVRRELKKIFGEYKMGHNEENILINPDFEVDAKCNRVPVLKGHLISVFFQTEKPAELDEIRRTLNEFKGSEQLTEDQLRLLPNFPQRPIKVFPSHQKDRPQPRIDLSNPDSGMTTFVGGLEPSNFPNGFKMTILSHNTELGAGRGAVLNAEYLYAKGLFGR